MDTNVIGRCWVHGIPEFESPSIAAISVHSLSPASHGNASGLGLADVIPARLLEQIDLRASYVNALTSGAGGARRSRLPMVMEDDEAAVLAAVTMCGRRRLVRAPAGPDQGHAVPERVDGDAGAADRGG